MVDHQFIDHPQTAFVRLAQKRFELAHRSIGLMDARVVCDVVAIVPQRRGIERQQPERRHAQVLQVVELVPQAAEIPDAVGIAVGEGTDVELVDNGVLVPGRVGIKPGRFPFAWGHSCSLSSLIAGIDQEIG